MPHARRAQAIGSRMPWTESHLALLRAAELLFAEKGIDRVSLRDISSAAGNGNHSAAQYHFETKRELIESLLERHSAPIQAGWLKRFEELDRRRKHTLADLVTLLVESLLDKLEDTDGGRAYLEICAQLAAHPELPLTSMRVVTTPGAAEFARRMRAASPAPPELFPLHALRLTGALYRSIVDYARLTDAGVIQLKKQAFADDLVGALMGLVQGSSKRKASAPRALPRQRASAPRARRR